MSRRTIRLARCLPIGRILRRLRLGVFQTHVVLCIRPDIRHSGASSCREDRQFCSSPNGQAAGFKGASIRTGGASIQLCPHPLNRWKWGRTSPHSPARWSAGGGDGRRTLGTCSTGRRGEGWTTEPPWSRAFIVYPDVRIVTLRLGEQSGTLKSPMSQCCWPAITRRSHCMHRAESRTL